MKGGLSAIINVQTEVSSNELKMALENNFVGNSFDVSELFENGAKVGFIIDTDLDETLLKDYLKDYFKVSFEFWR